MKIFPYIASVETLSVVDSLIEFFGSASDCSFLFGHSLILEEPLPILNAFREHNLVHTLGAPRVAMVSNWPRNFDDSTIFLNKIHNAIVFGGKVVKRDKGFHESGQLIVTSRGGIMQCSYGIMDGNLTLPSNLISPTEGGFELKADFDAELIKGDYYFIGSMHRHFGHSVLEGLSRLWALDFFPKKIKNNLKFIVYEDSLTQYSLDLLALAGICQDSIVYAPNCGVFERVYAPDNAYRTHHWSSVLQKNTWNRIKNNIVPLFKYKKIFLSRRLASDRPLENRVEVEDLFFNLGFHVIIPELLSVKQQLEIIMGAEIIAGEVGSQMYSAIVMGEKTKLFVIAPCNFYLNDDYLISSTIGSDLRVCFGTPIDFNLIKGERRWSVSIDDINRNFNFC